MAFVSISLILLFDFETMLNVFNRSTKRLSLLIEVLVGGAEGETSVNTRFHHFSKSGEFIFQSVPKFLFGHGIGSYGVLDIGQDVRHYPHNIVLEIFIELGFFGIMLFLMIHVIIFWKNINIFKGLTFLLFIYIFLNHMKSFSLVDMRLYFGFLSFYLLSHKYNL
jgi:O-antigen ligase